MSKPSTGWRAVTLEEVCEINPRDGAPANRDAVVSFVPMPAVSDTDGAIVSAVDRPFREVAKGFTRFTDGDVIFAKITPCMENGKIAVARGLTSGLACGSTEFHVLRPGTEVVAEYLWRFLRQRSFRQDAERHMTGAVGQRRVPTAFLKWTRIPLPSPATQRDIVAKLDVLIGRSSRARADLARVAALATRWKQAVLSAAFRGDLTIDWRRSRPGKRGGGLSEIARLRAAALAQRGVKAKPANTARWTPDIELPGSWSWVAVDELATLVQYGSSAKTCGSDQQGIPVLRMGNLIDGQLDYANLKYLPKSHAEFPELLLRDGDILFNRTNSAELVGKTAVYAERPHPTSFASYLIRLRVVGYVPGLLSAYINSPYGRAWVRSTVSQQVGQANVNGSKLRELGVPLMPFEEQEVLWQRVSARFAAMDRLLCEASRARRLLDRLDDASSDKAFRGELLESASDRSTPRRVG